MSGAHPKRSSLLWMGVFVSLVALGARDARAQHGTVAGTVVDGQTREPIAGASVSIVGTPWSTISEVNGAFTIFSVAPGTYSVIARRTGYASRQYTNVEVQIGVTRTLTFELRVSRTDTTETTVFESALVDPAIGRSLISLSGNKIAALPSLTLGGGLGVNGGYVQLPRTAGTLTLSDYRRGLTATPSVRGARSEHTLYLLEGFDVSNPVMGAPALLLEPLAAASVSFSPSFADAEHGGALAGLVNQALRDGSDRPSGALEFLTSNVAALLGSDASDKSGARAFRGVVSGGVPFVDNAVTFSIAGHMLGDRLGVVREPDGSIRGSGDHTHNQVVSKLTYTIRPTLRLSIAGLAQRRTAIDVDQGFVAGDSVAPLTLRDDSRFAVARIEKRFNRASIALAVAHNYGARENCSMWQGVCLEDRIQRIPQGQEIPVFGPPPRETPYALSGQYFGGERFRTNAARMDFVMQASDHNQIRVGTYVARHEIGYRDAIAYQWVQGVVPVVRDAYRVRPIEIASYVQDAIEHDLMTIRIGVRFDYGNNGGIAFVNPLNPTNGTTAREVCNGTAPGINSTAFTYGEQRGILACLESPAGASGRPVLLDSAARLAQVDDFHAVAPQVSFSPRIGLSFPITDDAVMFVNFGRYNRHALYHDTFRNTGNGSRAGLDDDADRMCEFSRRGGSSSECAPNILLDPRIPDFTGNPDLSFEQADGWEAGFMSRLGRLHSIDAVFFANEQRRLPTLYSVTQTPDFGLTYGPIGDRPIRTVLSRGWATSMGLSLTVRRRQSNLLSYAFNYTWQRASEAGARPDLLAEMLADPRQSLNNSAERASTLNRPHLFNAEASLQWRDNVPKKLGRVGRVLLQNSRTTATVFGASGSFSRTIGVSSNADLAQRAGGIGNLVNLMYARTLTTTGPQWALVVRVQNLLNSDDGSADLTRLRAFRGAAAGSANDEVILRRILTGIAMNF